MTATEVVVPAARPVSSKRPVILVLVAHYLPGFKAGGPIRSVAGIVDRLGDEFDLRIVTSDRDLGDSVAFPGIAADRWTSVRGAQVWYASPQGRRFARMGNLIRATPHDVLYLNSYFDPFFTIAPLVARRLGYFPKRPLLVAPRGEFAAGALGLKRMKKRGYRAVAKPLGLYRDATWVASSEREADNIRRTLGAGAGRVVTSPDLVPGEQGTLADAATGGSGEGLRVAFLGRISPVKNLDYALAALGAVREQVTFDIYGPIADANYWSRCRDLMSVLPPNAAARYRGELAHREVAAAMRQYDLMFLPTRGENFGHAIVEALSAGTPVLISDQTQWQTDAEGACQALPLAAPLSFARAIDQRARATPDERRKLRHAALAYATRITSDPGPVDATRRLLREAVPLSANA